MRPITKSDEGTTVWAKPSGCSPIQKRKIIRVWEDADSYEFKYGNWCESIADKDGFSRSTYRDTLSDDYVFSHNHSYYASVWLDNA